jgi:hypothetical protein
MKRIVVTLLGDISILAFVVIVSISLFSQDPATDLYDYNAAWLHRTIIENI